MQRNDSQLLGRPLEPATRQLCSDSATALLPVISTGSGQAIACMTRHRLQPPGEFQPCQLDYLIVRPEHDGALGERDGYLHGDRLATGQFQAVGHSRLGHRLEGHRLKSDAVSIVH